MWGPYSTSCDANPLAGIPPQSSLAVEDEQTLLDAVSSSCLGTLNDAAEYAADIEKHIADLKSQFMAIWEAKDKNELVKEANAVMLAQDLYNKAKENITGTYEKMKKFNLELYALNCIWDGAKNYALPEDVLKLKKSYESFGKANEALKEKIEKFQEKVAARSFSTADKDLFMEWEDVTENVEKAASGLNLIASYFSNPQKLLYYEWQVDLALSSAEGLSVGLIADCKIIECDRQLKRGISVGQAGLMATRKLAAQKRKCESKWRQKINDYVTTNFKKEDRGWEYYSDGDPRIVLLPQGAYGSYVNCHNEAITTEDRVKVLEQKLTKLSALCSKIQSIAPTLNERVNKYELLYGNGFTAAKNCDFVKATDIMKELQQIENSACGHFFPKPYGITHSQELKQKIEFYKAEPVCNDKVKLPASLTVFHRTDLLWPTTLALVKRGTSGNSGEYTGANFEGRPATATVQISGNSVVIYISVPSQGYSGEYRGKAVGNVVEGDYTPSSGFGPRAYFKAELKY